MKTVHFEAITEAVRGMCMEANFDIPGDVTAALEAARDAEESPTGRSILEQIIENEAAIRNTARRIERILRERGR